MYMTKQDVIQLRCDYTKHYVVKLKTHYKGLFKEIEKYNNCIQCDYEMSNSQKVYNWCYDIKKIPACPVTGKQLQFISNKWEYRKYGKRGVLSVEANDRRVKTRIKNGWGSPIKTDFKKCTASTRTFEELKDIFTKELINNAGAYIMKLKCVYPKELKQVWSMYNCFEPVGACVYCLLNGWKSVPICSVTGKPKKWLGFRRGFAEYSNDQKVVTMLKRKQRKWRYEIAEIYSREDTVQKLQEQLKNIPNRQNLKQILFKIDPSLVKSIEHHTYGVQLSRNTFAEKAFYLINGMPQDNAGKIKYYFESFDTGYEERFKYINESRGENEVRKWLNGLGIRTEKKRINRYLEIDIYMPDYKIGIEYNGEYYHSNLFKSPNFHLNKTERCREHGIVLLHIFDSEWVQRQEIIKSIILSKLNLIKRKIYARKCIVHNVSNTERKLFLNNNHLQGNDKSSISVGLYYNDELVSIMTFGTRKITGSTQFELQRFCSKLNTIVIGGASKLFSYFIKTHKNMKIVTYADRRLSTGNLYPKLGFTLSHYSSPTYYYFKPAMGVYMKLYHRSNFQKHTLHRRLSSFDSAKSEKENMSNNGYLHVYDCGHMVFKYCDSNI